MAKRIQDKREWVLSRVIASAASKYSNKACIRFVEEEVENDGRLETITFGELYATSLRFAAGLHSFCNLRKGDRLLVMLPNCIEFVVAWAAAAHLGAIFVPINTSLTGSFLQHIIVNSSSSTLLFDLELLPAVLAVLTEAELVDLKTVLVADIRKKQASCSVNLPAVKVLEYNQLLKQDSQLPNTSIEYYDTGAIMYTSGTTGPSKGVLMPYAHLHLFAVGKIFAIHLTSEDIYYICMPLFHANALFMQLYACLLMGTTAVLVRKFTASRWLPHIRQHDVTVTNTLGVMNQFLLNQPPSPIDTQHKLRAVLSAPINSEWVKGFRERFNVKLVGLYGMTEINIPLYMPYKLDIRHASSPAEKRLFDSCGRTNEDWFELRIVDPMTDEEVPRGTVGEIVVRPKHPWCFSVGYWRSPEKTVEAYRNLWFHTGDAALMDEAGFVYFVDRMKDCIRRRGENISSFEIEETVARAAKQASLGIDEVAAVPVPNPDVQGTGGEDEIKLCIVPNHVGHKVITERGQEAYCAAVLELCERVLPPFVVPRFIQLVPALPKTPNGKVQKHSLKLTKENVWERPLLRSAGRSRL